MFKNLKKKERNFSKKQKKEPRLQIFESKKKRKTFKFLAVRLKTAGQPESGSIAD